MNTEPRIRAARLARIERRMAEMMVEIAELHHERARIFEDDAAGAPAPDPLRACELDLEPLEPPDAPGVYVIQGVPGWVKIGRAQNIRQRMAELQVAHPVPLKLLAILDSNPCREIDFHGRFRPYRTIGEWFVVEPDLRATILAARKLSELVP